MKSSTAFSVSLALFPILNIYAIPGLPGLSIGQFLLVLLIGLRILINGFSKISCFKSFVIYSLIITAIGIVVKGYDLVDSIYESIALILFFVIFNYAIVSAEYAKVKKWIVYVGMFALAFFVIQYILFLAGRPISGIVSFLPLSNEVNTAEFRLTQMGRERLSSIFQEPAHYSEFMSIALAFILLKKDGNTKKKILLSIIISATIILSMSTSGAVFLALVWGAWCINLSKQTKHGKTILAMLMLLVVTAIPILLSSYLEYVSLRFSQISFTPEASEHGFSSYIRVLRGYIPFMESDVLDQIFGHGLGTLRSYIKQNPSTMFLSVTDFNETWVNSFQYLLFMTGIIGTVLFGKQMMYFYKGTTFLGKLFILQYISAFLSAGILLTPTSALFLFFIENEKELNNKNRL